MTKTEKMLKKAPQKMISEFRVGLGYVWFLSFGLMALLAIKNWLIFVPILMGLVYLAWQTVFWVNQEGLVYLRWNGAREILKWRDVESAIIWYDEGARRLEIRLKKRRKVTISWACHLLNRHQMDLAKATIENKIKRKVLVRIS